MKVKIINKSNNALPEYKSHEASGVDLMSNEDIVLKKDCPKLISTGLYMQIPKGYEGQVRPRSGLAIKHGVTVLNTPGTIDSDYRGEIKVILVNLIDKPYVIAKGDRIAQMVFTKVEHVDFEETDALDETIRGDGGFGHSGKN